MDIIKEVLWEDGTKTVYAKDNLGKHKAIKVSSKETKENILKLIEHAGEKANLSETMTAKATSWEKINEILPDGEKSEIKDIFNAIQTIKEILLEIV